MRPPLTLSHLTFPAIVAGFVAVLVGYTSSAAIIFQAAAAAGATASQTGGWLTMLGLAMGLTTLGLSLWYRTPVLTAWSTPGAALLVTSLPGTSLNEAVGVFVFASALIFLCGITGLFARLMNAIPQAISAAMLAGILLRFGVDAFAALQVNFALSGTMCLVYLLSRRLLPRYAIILTLLAGLGVAALQGNIHATQTQSLVMPEFIMPRFTLETLLGIGVPFFVVTMASQNAPGIATLKAHGYTLPVSPLIAWTGLVALLLALSVALPCVLPRLRQRFAWDRRCTAIRSAVTGPLPLPGCFIYWQGCLVGRLAACLLRCRWH
ncbi:hypothetical protein ERHA55_18720 [Erwinia rhapontici]|nr:hypothetical protein ERHA55_18720 [Erwinia rhapontici]